MIIKNVKTILFAGIIAAMILPFSMGNHVIAETFDGQLDTGNEYTYNTDSSGEDKLSDFTGKEITTNYTVLERAHSDVTNIMIDQSEKPLEVYDGPDIHVKSGDSGSPVFSSNGDELLGFMVAIDLNGDSLYVKHSKFTTYFRGLTWDF